MQTPTRALAAYIPATLRGGRAILFLQAILEADRPVTDRQVGPHLSQTDRVLTALGLLPARPAATGSGSAPSGIRGGDVPGRH
jgi:hypothetical protein